MHCDALQIYNYCHPHATYFRLLKIVIEPAYFNSAHPSSFEIVIPLDFSNKKDCWEWSYSICVLFVLISKASDLLATTFFCEISFMLYLFFKGLVF